MAAIFVEAQHGTGLDPRLPVKLIRDHPGYRYVAAQADEGLQPPAHVKELSTASAAQQRAIASSYVQRTETLSGNGIPYVETC